LPNLHHKTIVLLSGGLDSLVALASVLAEGNPVLKVITMDYGQRALAPELAATQAICDHYGLTRQLISLPWLNESLPPALTPKHQLASPEVVTDDNHGSTKRVWVPNRNGVLLNIAAAVAEGLGATRVVFGANAQEAQGFPDNTPEYRDQLNLALQYSTLNHVQVATPVGHLFKTDIVHLGVRLDAPLHLLWSCYEEGPIHCGLCPSCLLLKEALIQANQAGLLPFKA